MSTTIDILPVESTEITFGQVISLSQKHIHSFLKSAGIEKEIELNVTIRDKDEKYTFDIELSDTFQWKENEYAWFTIKGIAGGTDAYCESVVDPDDSDDPWWKLTDFLEGHKTIGNIDLKLEKSKKLDRMWSFRRSAGQPGIINIGYGIISASIAELTSGILSSTDGAWDYRQFPAESKEFLEFYFRPDKAMNEDDAEWARSGISGVERELLRPTTYKNNGEESTNTKDRNNNKL